MAGTTVTTTTRRAPMGCRSLGAVVGALAVLVAPLGTFGASGLAPTAPSSASVASTHGAVGDELAPPSVAHQLAARSPKDEFVGFVHGRDLRSALAAIEATGLEFLHAFPRIDVAAALGSPAALAAAEKIPGVDWVEVERPRQLDQDTSHLATRGEEAQRGFLVHDESGSYTSTGVDGSGVSIAIVDSGIDGTHPFFDDGNGSSKVVRNLVFACSDLVDCDGPQGDARDELWVDVTATGNNSDQLGLGGHGTHVAGIAAGGFDELSDGRRLHGTAPGAKLVGLAAAAHGIPFYIGMNWVLEHHAEPCGRPASTACPAIKVVNASYGYRLEDGDELYYNPASVEAKLQDALVAEGVTVVRSAGNQGGDGSLSRVNAEAQSPTPGVISVAAYDDFDIGARDGVVVDVSSRGKVSDPRTYPDVSAPGAQIVSSCRPTLPECYLQGDIGDRGRYYSLGGTSMAAPHITGIVAQLLQANPALTPAQVEDAIEDTAYQFTAGGRYVVDPLNPDHTTSFEKGHGLVDVVGAVSRARQIPFRQSVAPEHRGCTAGADVASDVAGDARGLGVRSVAPNEPALDLLQTTVTEVDDGLIFTIGVSRVGTVNPPAAPSVSFGAGFSYAGRRWSVAAVRDVSGKESFSFEEQVSVGPAQARLRLAAVEGAFDPDAGAVRVVLPVAMLRGHGGGMEGAYSVLDEFRVVSWRAYPSNPVLAGAFADEAVGRCAFAIGTGVVPSPPSD